MAMNNLISRHRLETQEEWEKWREKIPAIHFPSDWRVKLLPPFGGAMVRFHILNDNDDMIASVYLDCHSALGSCEGPYWEAYPYRGDTFRCDIGEVYKLMDILHEIVDKQLEE